MRDPYTILQLERGATAEQVNAAYRKLARQLHPDRGGSTEAFAELAAAVKAIRSGMKAVQVEPSAEDVRRAVQNLIRASGGHVPGWASARRPYPGGRKVDRGPPEGPTGTIR